MERMNQYGERYHRAMRDAKALLVYPQVHQYDRRFVAALSLETERLLVPGIARMACAWPGSDDADLGFFERKLREWCESRYRQGRHELFVMYQGRNTYAPYSSVGPNAMSAANVVQKMAFFAANTRADDGRQVYYSRQPDRLGQHRFGVGIWYAHDILTLVFPQEQDAREALAPHPVLLAHWEASRLSVLRYEAAMLAGEIAHGTHESPHESTGLAPTIAR